MEITFDDTDSKINGCTTFLATEIISLLQENNFYLRALPRLVRLNPNCKKKTRGNAAVCVSVGYKIKKSKLKKTIGLFDAKKIYIYSHLQMYSRKLFLNLKKFFEKYKPLFYVHSFSPGLIIFKKKKSNRETYLCAVQKILSVYATIELIRANTNILFFFGSDGLVGAYYASFWTNRGSFSTYELISYRSKQKQGLMREHSIRNLKNLIQKKFFYRLYDEAYGRQCIFPGTSCPVLFGFQGTNNGKMLYFFNKIHSEKYSSFMFFVTNQNSGDHYVHITNKNELEKNVSYSIKCSFYKILRILPGGHILFSVRLFKTGEEVVCICFERSKKIRLVLEALFFGDSILLFGAFSDKKQLCLEKITILSIVQIKTWAKARCPGCNVAMHSCGAKNHFMKCKKCKRKKLKEYMYVSRKIDYKTYFPPIRSTRHLTSYQ